MARLIVVTETKDKKSYFFKILIHKDRSSVSNPDGVTEKNNYINSTS